MGTKEKIKDLKFRMYYLNAVDGVGLFFADTVRKLKIEMNDVVANWQKEHNSIPFNMQEELDEFDRQYQTALKKIWNAGLY